MKNTYCLKTLQDEGVIQTGGTDSPVESYDPMKGIYAAVVVLDEDIFIIKTEDILKANVLKTYVAGNEVFSI